ncbi:MAG: hypothetical protein K2K90_11445 [Lachnospiraceae bacterium]|nr:hypothetical protein [Lachnospiraceae bacterium]
MAMARADEIFRPALVGKKIPILTLDNKWHKLFTKSEFTTELKGMEKNLNDMLKRQAKLNTETKELKKLKKKLMDEVVILADAMGERPTKKQDKEMADHRRLIEECNEKMDAYEEELVELPRQINQLNNQLMLITMDVCYRKLQQNTKELSEIEEWISGIRRELKKKVVRKQEKEAVINRLYAYMHDIFGAEVIELFDMQYDPEEKYRRKENAAQAESPEKQAEDQEKQAEKKEKTKQAGQPEKSAEPEGENT